MTYSLPLKFFKNFLWLVVTFLMFYSLVHPNSIVQNNFSTHLTKYEQFKISGSYEKFEGYNMYILESKDLSNFEVLNRTLLITDLGGKVYFSRDVGTSGSLATRPIELINSNTVFYGTDMNSYMWNLEKNITTELDFWSHHDTEYNYINDTYFALKSYDIVHNDRTYRFDYVNEYTPDGDLIWFLDTRSFINYSQWCPFENSSPPFDQYGGVRDVVHANTVYYDDLENMLYLNCRNVNTFYKIDHETKEVLWGLGEYGNFTLFDIQGIEQEQLFFHAHSLEKTSGNKFVLFDNDYHNQTNAINNLSRLLEITIDEDKMYANITREWISPSSYFSRSYGDCDILPNNNLLGVFGTYSHPSSDYGAIISEVDEMGNIQWEVAYPNSENVSFEVFQIERLRFAPIVSSPLLIDEGDGTGYLEWDVWYNFRSKTKFVGHYYITIDNQTLENGEIEFPRWWQSTKIRYDLNELNGEEQEIVLAVSDEEGHLSNETEFYNSPDPPKLKKGLIIGLSVGGASLVVSAVVIWIKYPKVKSFFRNKK